MEKKNGREKLIDVERDIKTSCVVLLVYLKSKRGSVFKVRHSLCKEEEMHQEHHLSVQMSPNPLKK